jgi:hypothetical protein
MRQNGTMKIALGTIAIVVGLMGGAGVASAFQCPALIEQAKAALDQYRRTPGLAAIKDARIAAAEANIRSAEASHAGGQHDEAVRQAKEALSALGK